MIQEMADYLDQLIDEFAMHKKELAERQQEAERARKRQDEVWARLRRLSLLGDLVRNTGGYGEFRSAYGQALTAMRTDLAGATMGPRRSGTAAPSPVDESGPD